MLIAFEDANLLKVEYVHEKHLWEASTFKTEEITQYDLGQNTNTSIIVPSLNVYERSSLECFVFVLTLMKLCYFRKAYQLNFIKRIYYKCKFFLNKHLNDYFDGTSKCSSERILKMAL